MALVVVDVDGPESYAGDAVHSRAMNILHSLFMNDEGTMLADDGI
jgi:hypothetical protein